MQMVYPTIEEALKSLRITISIEQEGDSKRVIIHSPLHIKKEHTLKVEFSADFSREDILTSPYVVNELVDMYGIKGVTGFTL